MRLTKKRADNGKYYLSGLAEVSNSYSKGYGRIQVGHAVEKLAQYEDLEEIFRSKMTDAACEFLRDKEEFAKWLDRNKWIAKKCDEYARAEEQGKLLKLPCAVGDTVYSFSSGKIFTFHVGSFAAHADGIYARLVSDMEEYKFLTADMNISDFGKKWFLTSEEAEAALKEL